MDKNTKKEMSGKWEVKIIMSIGTGGELRDVLELDEATDKAYILKSAASNGTAGEFTCS